MLYSSPSLSLRSLRRHCDKTYRKSGPKLTYTSFYHTPLFLFFSFSHPSLFRPSARWASPCHVSTRMSDVRTQLITAFLISFPLSTSTSPYSEIQTPLCVSTLRAAKISSPNTVPSLCGTASGRAFPVYCTAPSPIPPSCTVHRSRVHSTVTSTRNIALESFLHHLCPWLAAHLCLSVSIPRPPPRQPPGAASAAAVRHAVMWRAVTTNIERGAYCNLQVGLHNAVSILPGRYRPLAFFLKKLSLKLEPEIVKSLCR